MIENEIELDRTCQNCSSFFQDSEDMDFGICMNDKIFEPYIDEILEGENFSSCHELYLQKRFEGVKEACEQFEIIEYIDIPEDEDINTCFSYEVLMNQNVDEIVNYLYNTDLTVVKNALSAISTYVNIGNRSAYDGVLNYYLSLDPAENLDDVYIRKDIINMFSRYESERRTIEAYVNELERTPSNNTTRQLYSLLLERLDRCNNDIVFDLLDELLSKKKYSYKVRKRIMDVMESDYALFKEYPF